MAAPGKVDLKVCLLGKSAAGKTCLLDRLLRNHWAGGQSQATIGASFGQTVLKSSTGERVSTGLWDTAGQERYESMGRHYYKDAHGAAICFDVTDFRSWEKVDFWFRELKENGPDNITMAIVGCKADLLEGNPRRRAVPEAVVQAYAERHGAQVFYTSALTGDGCEAPFKWLVDEFVLLRKNRPQAVRGRDGVAVDLPQPQSSKTCCFF